MWIRPKATKLEPLESMSKAFTRETDGDDEDDQPSAFVRAGKNYMTQAGYDRLRNEWQQLMDVERPKMVEIVSWAAGNGDRSENGDYLYGKRRLREIDRRIRFLTKRIEMAEVVEPSIHQGSDQVFFGATVHCEDHLGESFVVTILGIDEADSGKSQITWISPMAKALLKARVGDVVKLHTPSGWREIEVVRVDYPTKGES